MINKTPVCCTAGLFIHSIVLNVVFIINKMPVCCTAGLFIYSIVLNVVFIINKISLEGFLASYFRAEYILDIIQGILCKLEITEKYINIFLHFYCEIVKKKNY